MNDCRHSSADERLHEWLQTFVIRMTTFVQTFVIRMICRHSNDDGRHSNDVLSFEWRMSADMSADIRHSNDRIRHSSSNVESFEWRMSSDEWRHSSFVIRMTSFDIIRMTNVVMTNDVLCQSFDVIRMTADVRHSNDDVRHSNDILSFEWRMSFEFVRCAVYGHQYVFTYVKFNWHKYSLYTTLTADIRQKAFSHVFWDCSWHLTRLCLQTCLQTFVIRMTEFVIRHSSFEWLHNVCRHSSAWMTADIRLDEWLQTFVCMNDCRHSSAWMTADIRLHEWLQTFVCMNDCRHSSAVMTADIRHSNDCRMSAVMTADTRTPVCINRVSTAVSKNMAECFLTNVCSQCSTKRILVSIELHISEYILVSIDCTSSRLSWRWCQKTARQAIDETSHQSIDTAHYICHRISVHRLLIITFVITFVSTSRLSWRLCQKTAHKSIDYTSHPSIETAHYICHHVCGGNIVQHTVSHCNTSQHIATHRNTLQHTATHCNTLQPNWNTATHGNTLQHTATHCNTL